MKFAITLIASTLFVLAIATAGPGTKQFGPFLEITTDGGSCGEWANDTFQRRYTVISNGSGSFAVKENDNGNFVTLGGASPGACATNPHHGSTVRSGIQGNIQGTADFKVSSTTFNPNGCDANPSGCATRGGFISAVFGSAAVGTIAFTSYNFEYSSSDQSLSFHHWQDKSTDHAQGSDKFEGDIANQ